MQHIIKSVSAIKKSGMNQHQLDAIVMNLMRVIGREHLDEQGAEFTHNRLVECASNYPKSYHDGLAFLAMNAWVNGKVVA